MGLLAGLSGRRVLCLDWDARNLRIVVAAVGKGDARIVGVAEVPVPPDVEVGQAGSFGAFLKAALRQKGLRADRVVMCVPRQDAVLNPLTLPRTADDELASMVRFQVSKELPFTLDQASVDFAVMRKEGGEGGGMDVLVAAVRNHVVEYYKAVADVAGLTLDRLGLRPYANAVAMTRDAAGQKGRVLVVDVGPAMTEIDVVRDGRLVFSRAAAVAVRVAPGASETAAEPSPAGADAGVIPFLDTTDRANSAVDELLVEVTRTLAAYRASDPAATIDRVVVAGACGIENDLSEAMAKRFESPTSIYRPGESLIRGLGRRTEVAWSGFGAVLGLAWGSVYSGTAHFDFVHPKQPVDKRREQMRRVPAIAALVGVVLLATGTAVGLKMHSRIKTINELDRRLKAGEEELKDIREFNARVDATEAWRQRKITWLDELRVVATTLPTNKEAYLRELRITDGGEISLELVAADGKVIERICDSLAGLKTDKGAPRYIVTPGARTPTKEPKYKEQTNIRVQLETMAPKPVTQKSGKR